MRSFAFLLDLLRLTLDNIDNVTDNEMTCFEFCLIRLLHRVHRRFRRLVPSLLADGA